MAQPHEHPQAPAHQCPWCSFTDVLLKKVLMHMESAHQGRWCDRPSTADRWGRAD